MLSGPGLHPRTNFVFAHPCGVASTLKIGYPNRPNLYPRSLSVALRNGSRKWLSVELRLAGFYGSGLRVLGCRVTSATVVRTCRRLSMIPTAHLALKFESVICPQPAFRLPYQINSLWSGFQVYGPPSAKAQRRSCTAVV